MACGQRAKCPGKRADAGDRTSRGTDLWNTGARFVARMKSQGRFIASFVHRLTKVEPAARKREISNRSISLSTKAENLDSVMACRGPGPRRPDGIAAYLCKHVKIAPRRGYATVLQLCVCITNSSHTPATLLRSASIHVRIESNTFCYEDFANGRAR